VEFLPKSLSLLEKLRRYFIFWYFIVFLRQTETGTSLPVVTFRQKKETDFESPMSTASDNISL
jgi:hypothetical protein